MNENYDWIKLGPLPKMSTDYPEYRTKIGIYKAILNGEIVYIGKAIELDNGGLTKRLRDYTRDSDSGRNYSAGRLMHEHRDDIEIEILVFEEDENSIPEIEKTEISLIDELDPAWNCHHKD